LNSVFESGATLKVDNSGVIFVSGEFIHDKGILVLWRRWPKRWMYTDI